MSDFKSSKELIDAWFDFKKNYKKSGRGGTPNLVSFTAGFNRAMSLVQQPPKVQFRTGYIVVSYKIEKDNKCVLFLDAFNKKCLIVDDSGSDYVISPFTTKNIKLHDKRKDARQEASLNQDRIEAVWKVTLDDEYNKIEWLKKNP